MASWRTVALAKTSVASLAFHPTKNKESYLSPWVLRALCWSAACVRRRLLWVWVISIVRRAQGFCLNGRCYSCFHLGSNAYFSNFHSAASFMVTWCKDCGIYCSMVCNVWQHCNVWPCLTSAENTDAERAAVPSGRVWECVCYHWGNLWLTVEEDEKTSDRSYRRTLGCSWEQRG